MRMFAAMATCAVFVEVLACGEDGLGPEGTARPSGSIQVNVRTTGSPLDHDGYTVQLGREPGRPARVNDTVIFTGLTTGDYALRLTGVAPECVLQGPNPRHVTVAENRVSITFEVTCADTAPDDPGAIRVDVTTRDSLPDSAGFTVVLLGRPSQRVGANGSALFTGLAPRDYLVELHDLPWPCVVDGSASEMASVSPGDTTHVTFAVVCTEHGSFHGSIQVNVNTTGAPLDPDGYRIILDGLQVQTAPVNGTVLFTDLDSPHHSIQLDGVA